jgi:hypothetical protein
MNNLLTALIIVLAINGLLWMSQKAVTDLNPEMSFYNGEGGVLENHNMSSGTDPYTELPTSGGAVTTDTGNIFIDTFGSLMNWLAQKTGFDTVIQTLKAPYTYLKIMGVPVELANVLGSLWYLVTITLVVLVVTGRN